MGLVLYFIVCVLMVYVFIKNLKMFKRYKQNRDYIEAYEDVLHNKENCYERINDYIEKEKSLEYKNKARIIKLYAELNRSLDYKNTLNEINLHDLFNNKNGRFDLKLMKFDSDCFVFIMIDMFKAYSLNKMDVVNNLYNKVKELNEIDNYIEYQEVSNLYKALSKKEDCGNKFMHDLVDGNYTNYMYDKNLIILYKRIACAILVFNNEVVDEYFNEDLKKFTKMSVGSIIMEALKLKDKYLEKEDVE